MVFDKARHMETRESIVRGPSGSPRRPLPRRFSDNDEKGGWGAEGGRSLARRDGQHAGTQAFSEPDVVSWVYYTYPFNLTGNPAASIPCDFTADGLPEGLQVVAGTNREADLLRLSAAFESAQPWANSYPELPV